MIPCTHLTRLMNTSIFRLLPRSRKFLQISSNGKIPLGVSTASTSGSGFPSILQSPFKPASLPKKHTSLMELLIQKSKEHAKNGRSQWMTDALTGETYNFNCFDDLTRRIGSAFYKRGLRKGDIVLFMGIDVVKQPIFLGGIWRANGIGRASYPEDAEEEETVSRRVKESRTRWIYCDPMHAPVCLQVAKKMEWNVEVIVSSQEPVPGCSSIYEFMKDDGSALPTPEMTAKDIAIIMCTSGTTGASKGAMLTQSAIIWQICTCSSGASTHPEEEKENTLLMLAKSTHVSGIIFTYALLLAGVHSYYLAFISRETILSAVGKHKPSFILGFPTFLLLLVHDPEAAKLDLTTLNAFACAGAPLTPEVQKALMTLPSLKFVLNLYGLTECGPVASNLDFRYGLPIQGLPDGSMGHLAPGVSAKVIDLESGETVGPGEMGELCIKSGGMFRQYYLQPEETRSSFDGDFFKTGDVVYYDENGFLFLVDRAKEIFKYFNNHIAPTEIENIILRHPAVAEVCVVGVHDPNGAGQIPRAFCVTVSGSSSTTQEILEYSNSKLARYKQLRGGLFFLPELPKGKTGKVSRQILESFQVETCMKTK